MKESVIQNAKVYFITGGTQANRIIIVLSAFYIWKNIDANHDAIWLITSWATTDAMANRFVEAI
ncbi:MAG: hypothetical protein Q4C98_06460 [Capnocytophaga sp.]|nr:hypothetical protein [Capnocytophaga sp.]